MSEIALSQSLEPVTQEPVERTLPALADVIENPPATNEFDYRPVPIAAPIAMFLGFCSFVGLFTPVGLGVGLFGMLLGAICWFRIRQSGGELGGKWIAATGCALSFLFLVSGSALFAFNVATEVPPGFERLNFRRDISLKGFVVEKGKSAVHPDVAALEGKEVFIKGYMYPEKTTQNLTSFLLVKDNQVCCFGGQPSLNDMIMVKMKDGAKVNHSAGLVAVAGVFHAAKAPSPAGYDAVYTIEATHSEPAKTNF